MLQGFTHRDSQVARVMHCVAEFLKACRQACIAQCTWAETYAAVRLAEVYRDTDYLNYLIH